MTVLKRHPSIHDAIVGLTIDRDAGAVTIGDRTLADATPRELRRELSNAIYELWHSGVRTSSDGHGIIRRDRSLEARLEASVPFRRSWTQAVVRASVDTDPGFLVADVGRVRVRVPVDLVPTTRHSAGDQISLPLPALRPCLSPGFLLVDGQAGTPTDTGHLLRAYVHVATADAAPHVLGCALRVLEHHAVRYRAKVVSRSGFFPRWDALVLYLDEHASNVVPNLVREVAGATGVADATPLMAQRVAAGVALAWEPSDSRPGWTRMSFGQHRAAVVADGIQRHMSDGQPLPDAVAEAMREASVDPDQPARNLTSPAFPEVNPAGGAGRVVGR
jgi:hypothetical protein